MACAAICVIFAVLMAASFTSSNLVVPTCSPDSPVCEVLLVLEHRYTMMHYSPGDHGAMRPVVVGKGGRFYVKTDCNDTVKISEDAKSRVITGDGSYKLVISVNGSVPGPPITVYEGQQMAVTVFNKLENEATTLHFHGLHQRRTPWMDGASGVSQCAINPGERFTYRFLASPVGTHWYHAHLGTQRTMGAYGAFLVLARSHDHTNQIRGSDPLPDFDDEFSLIVQDWMRPSSYDILTNVRYELVSYSYGFESDLCYNSTKQGDGMDCGVTPFYSALVNGKGRYFSRIPGDAEPQELPLETIVVQKGGRYRFRVICSSMTFAFRVAIDGHMLNVIATDGNDVRAREVESLIIFSGERYDFWIDAHDFAGMGNYWIRFETLERTQNGEAITPGHVEAILHYTEAAEVEPTSTRTPCIKEQPCETLNCPYSSVVETTIKCVPVTELVSTQSLLVDNAAPFQEHFLNFHFSGFETFGVWRPTVNGVRSVLPPYPYQVYPEKVNQSSAGCGGQSCGGDICRCPYLIDVPLGTTLQLTFTITVTNPPGIMNGNSHPIHLHGHQFQVLKIGWPVYDATTKFYKHRSWDVDCDPHVHNCNRLLWSNASWEGGHVPGMKGPSAPRKDTVMVPIGGYVVTRLKANNPGFWYMHCHTEFHNAEGMSVTFKVGDVTEMPTPPLDQRTCGNFHWSDQDFVKAVTKPEFIQPDGSPSPGEEGRLSMAGLLTILSVCMGTLSTCLFFLIVVLFCQYRHHQSYTYLANTPQQ